jgi:hypothetical protein
VRITYGSRAEGLTCGQAWPQTAGSLTLPGDHIKQPERIAAWMATTGCSESLRTLRVGGRQVASADDFDVRADLGAWEGFHKDILAGARSRLVDQLVKRLPVRSQILSHLLTTDPPLGYRNISASMSMPIGSIRAYTRLGIRAVAATRYRGRGEPRRRTVFLRRDG